MRARTPLPLLLATLAGLCAGACANARKKATSGASLLGLPVATPLTEEETVAALKAIAGSENASLAPVDADPGGALPDESTGDATEERTPEVSGFAAGPPDSWKSRGLNPGEVNPGDVFVERRGPYLRKVMSLLDELPPAGRNPLLNEFTVSKTTRVPLTLSRAELAELEKEADQDLSLPTRSVALDFRRETHLLEPDRFEALLSRIEEGKSAGAIAPVERLALLRKQLADVKRRLERGDELHLVTSVGESSVVHATYPGAPVGKRDAAPIRNAVALLHPHAGELEAEKTANGIELTGAPRIVWEFETRELRLDQGRLVTAPAPPAGR